MNNPGYINKELARYEKWTREVKTTADETFKWYQWNRKRASLLNSFVNTARVMGHTEFPYSSDHCPCGEVCIHTATICGMCVDNSQHRGFTGNFVFGYVGGIFGFTRKNTIRGANIAEMSDLGADGEFFDPKVEQDAIGSGWDMSKSNKFNKSRDVCSFLNHGNVCIENTTCEPCNEVFEGNPIYQLYNCAIEECPIFYPWNR